LHVYKIRSQSGAGDLIRNAEEEKEEKSKRITKKKKKKQKKYRSIH
jgi:hypothetical protein